MLTSLKIQNFKCLRDAEIELGMTVVFVGPNNSGKTTALQALALWDIGLRKWLGANGNAVALNRRDLVSVPVPDTAHLWRDLQHASHEPIGQTALIEEEVHIRIEASGTHHGESWTCGFAFTHANSESLYCIPLHGSSEIQPGDQLAAKSRIAFLPPMSGLAATEDALQPGSILVRIGEGRTAEILRNLCYRLAEAEDKTRWESLTSEIHRLFGVSLNSPIYIAERGQITMSYRERGIELDLASTGRGLQQTLLLLAHLYANPGCVLLLDEPDAHLEILRQRQIYQVLVQTAAAQGCQIIAASHSEILLNEAAERDIVIAFLGKPHRIDDRGSQTAKSLKAIGFEQYYQAEQKGWVLYLEGSTDLAILQAFAQRLNHPAAALLERPFVHYVANVPAKARDHFQGLREAKKDLTGIAIFDRIDNQLNDANSPLRELKWRQCEAENYLCFRETLDAFAAQLDAGPAPLFEPVERTRQQEAMRESIAEVSSALKTLGEPDPFGPDIKASDKFLAPVFRNYFSKLRLPNLMQKSGFHTLAGLVPLELLAPEISEKLDLIVATAKLATSESP